MLEGRYLYRCVLHACNIGGFSHIIESLFN